MVLGKKHAQKKKPFIENYKRCKKSVRKLIQHIFWITLALIDILYLCIL